jgi:hypothetical protein
MGKADVGHDETAGQPDAAGLPGGCERSAHRVGPGTKKSSREDFLPMCLLARSAVATLC